MSRKARCLLCAVCICSTLCAKEIVVGPQEVSPWPDTEVSTNVAFNARRNDVRTFDVCIKLEATASNCVQVAFGRDADDDGDLSPKEAGLILGWRAGRCFVEDVGCCGRGAQFWSGICLGWRPPLPSSERRDGSVLRPETRRLRERGGRVLRGNCRRVSAVAVPCGLEPPQSDAARGYAGGRTLPHPLCPPFLRDLHQVGAVEPWTSLR